MRPLLALACLAALLAAPLARADGPIRAPAITPRPLPAGLWFRDDAYERSVLSTEPPAPTDAVVLGPFRTGAAAERALGGAPHELWRLGYPWVAAGSELIQAGRCTDRIYVVLGLFASTAEARAYAAAHRGARTLALHAEAEEDCAHRERPLQITHVEREIGAYAPEAIETIEEWPVQPSSIHTAARCTIPSGRVFAYREDLSDPEPGGVGSPGTIRFGYRWARVDCPSGPAYVPVEATRRHIVVEPNEGADSTLYQLTDVMCDGANFDPWRLAEEGRHVIDGDEPTFMSACAG